ncbi:MAG TPA: hypothetical protein VNI61_07245 [Gemmatimonadales bacterium]|nr:hypothetical protein [Gemmatimonadales bacterium]
MRPLAVVGAALALAAGACVSTTDPRSAIVSYAVSVLGCAAGDCSLPDDTLLLTVAERGDTVWVFSGVEGGNPLVGDSALVTLRADCAENVVLLDGTATARTFPSPVTCPDSVVTRFVKRPPQPAEHRFFQWVVDSSLTPGSYVVEGRMLVAPDLRPALIFQVR